MTRIESTRFDERVIKGSWIYGWFFSSVHDQLDPFDSFLFLAKTFGLLYDANPFAFLYDQF
jgi:hypothetical protein